LAQAGCDADFGKHQSPPAPVWAPTVDDLPFARFDWGADASIDQYKNWWGLNVIKNDAQGVPLAVNWDKGGIFIPLPKPLPKGGLHCNNSFLQQGQNNIPVLDRDAPIVYSSNRRHDAVVYIGGKARQESSKESEPSSNSAQKPEFATTLIDTSYEDSRLGLRHVRVEVTSEFLPPKYDSDIARQYNLYLYKPATTFFCLGFVFPLAGISLTRA
jgi:hypothetical protein